MPAEAPREAARLVPFTPDRADLVATWARDAAEVRAWCAREAAAVPADVIRGWAAEPDVEAWLLVDVSGASDPTDRTTSGAPVAYGELWLDREADEVELARLIVDPARRGRGLGRLLARLLAERARAAHPALALVALRVEPGNEAAVRAYRGAGFRRVDPATEAAWNAGQRTAWTWMRLP